MPLVHNLASLVYSQPDLWKQISDLETKFLKSKLQKDIENPIYITGLARCGTTIMLEALSNHKDVAFHQYRDFPMMFTPYFWHKLLSFFDKFSIKDKSKERSHGDNILVSPKSPESMEEILWMSFFKNTSSMISPEFTKFYQEHIKKLLFCRGKERYLSKANYNISRLEYINSMFSDPKFIIIVRDPVSHINSLSKIHNKFCDIQKYDKSALKQMNLSGHFEFGLNRKSIFIEEEKNNEIEKLFKEGKQILAWSKYWSLIYSYVANLFDNKELKKKIMLVKYEDLCENSEEVLRNVFRFCDLEYDSNLIKKYKKILTNSNKVDLSEEEISIVRSNTSDVANFYGYN